MKKIIAILVVFAMVATVAFAETTFGGSAEVRWSIAGGAPDIIRTSGAIDNAAFFLSGGNDEGTYGGMAKFVFGGHQPNPGRTWEVAPQWYKWDRVFAWWQPIPQLRVFLGFDGDGHFNTANLSRWGHHRMDRGIAVEDWDAGDYLLGNWDAFGLALMIRPIDGLAVNFAMNIPQSAAEYDATNGPLENLQVQASYGLDGVGTFIVTFKNSGQDRIGLTYQSAGFVDGLSFEVGGNYNLDNDIIYVGIGVHYNADVWGVRSRFFMQPNASFFYLKADIMPFFNFDFGTLFVNFRVLTVNSSTIGWHVNPYLRMPMGGHDFRVGLLLEDHNGDGTISWRLPVSMLVNF